MADYSILLPGNHAMVQERERFLLGILRKSGWDHLRELRVFEAGCSSGYNLRQFLQWGARPDHLAGMDISDLAVHEHRALSPNIRIHQGSAENVPEPDDEFDLSLAFTLFSSVPDEAVATGIAGELLRVTRPGGLILIYDMRRKSRSNPNVHPVSKSDIHRWFPGAKMLTRSITLAPPVARRVTAFAPWLYGPLAAIPPLRTHTMTVVRLPRH